MTPRNGWTGGQYSVFRALLGAYLAVHFATLVPWGAELFSSAGMLPEASASPLAHAFPNVLTWFDAPWFVTALLVAATAASLLLALGAADRPAAVLLWYVGACLLGRNPLVASPALPYVGWMLLAHALVPRAPFGALASRGRTDPDGGWRLPQGIFVAAWVAMAVGYAYSGITKLGSPSWVDGSAISEVLANPLARDTGLRVWLLALPPSVLQVATWSALALEIGFAPLALSRRLRPWLWLAMLGMHGSLIALVDFADLSLGMVLLHGFTFDPAWLRRRSEGAVETLLYDGDCGLCHAFVRFVLAEDRGAFCFAPLEGGFAQRHAERSASALPESLVVVRADGVCLSRYRAVLHVLERLGGLWRAMAFGLRAVPRPLGDLGYAALARLRRTLSAPPPAACPLVPSHLRERFVH